MTIFFSRPFLDLIDGGFPSGTMNIPAVNIIERKEDYLVSHAAPGLKKEDFKIDVEGNMLIISSEKEEKKEEKEENTLGRNTAILLFNAASHFPMQ